MSNLEGKDKHYREVTHFFVFQKDFFIILYRGPVNQSEIYLSTPWMVLIPRLGTTAGELIAVFLQCSGRSIQTFSSRKRETILNG